MHPYLQGPFRPSRRPTTALTIDPAALGIFIFGGLALIALIVGMF